VLLSGVLSACDANAVPDGPTALDYGMQLLPDPTPGDELKWHVRERGQRWEVWVGLEYPDTLEMSCDHAEFRVASWANIDKRYGHTVGHLCRPAP
jgi:hypothetical protein